MKLSGLFISSIIVLAFIVGCENRSNPTLAVVDLDKVAISTGQMKVIEEEMRVFTEQTQTTLNQIKDELNTHIESAKKDVGQKPSAEEQAELQKTALTAQLTLKQELAQGEKLIAQKRTQLVQAYRQSIEPSIRRVATQQGIKIVMIKQPNLIYIEGDADITDAVIDAVQTLPVPGSATKSNNGSEI